MARNSSGTYSLPAGNPVVSGTTIQSSWANSTLSDIATALTNSLDRTGSGGMLAPLGLVDGTVGVPAIAWNDDPSTGFYRAAAGEVRFSSSGADLIKLSSGTFSLIGDDDGAAASPELTLSRISATPAANDILGVLKFVGKDSAGSDTVYGQLHGEISTATDGSEDGKLTFSLIHGGAEKELLSLYSSSVLELISDDDGASEGPTISLFRDSASAASSDELGVISFEGDSFIGRAAYAGISAEIIGTSSIPSGALLLKTQGGAGLGEALKLDQERRAFFRGATEPAIVSILSDGSNKDLHIQHNSGSASLTMKVNDNLSNCRIGFGDLGGDYFGEIRYDHSAESLEFYAAATKALTITQFGTLELEGGVKEKVHALSGTSVDLDPDNGSRQTHTLTGATTYTSSIGAGESLTLAIDTAGNAVTWPTMEWIGGSAPVLDSSNTNYITLWNDVGTLIGSFTGPAS